MNRNVLVAAFLSLLLHAGVALGGRFFREKPVAPAAAEPPTITLDLPPPPEPEEPEVFENTLAEAPASGADLAPPMLNDTPSAQIDSPFVQPFQAPPPADLVRSAGSSFRLPTAPPRPGSGGTGLGKVFNLGDLDEKLEPRVRPAPVYPFEMRRAGLTGEVTLEFVVDPQGNVRDPVIVHSTHPGFEQPALDAVRRWKFKPGKKAGVAVSTRARQTMPFGLD